MKMIRYNSRTGERIEFEDGEPARVPQFACPCCHCRTLADLAGYEICAVCFWEDDGQGDADADIIRGGPNGKLSLSEARRNFIALGACEESMVKNVRPPYPDEIPKP